MELEKNYLKLNLRKVLKSSKKIKLIIVNMICFHQKLSHKKLDQNTRFLILYNSNF